MSGAESLTLLAIDTSGMGGTVAIATIAKGTEEVTYMAGAELGNRAAASDLVPTIASLLEQTRRSLSDLDALVVVHGPGSFTGVRVGLSTAKGLAHAGGTPVYAVSRLAVLAHVAADRAAVALLDAGRGEFYARHEEREWLASLEEVSAAAEAGAVLVLTEPGLAEQLAQRLSTAATRVVGPVDAMAAVRASLGRLRSATPDDLATLDANYLRRSDAELFARPAAR